MSHDRERKPAKQPPRPPLWAEQGITPSPFFRMPTVPTGGEIVVPDARPPVVNAQRPWPLSPQQTGPVVNQSADSVSPRQSPQGQGRGLAGQDRAQLQRLCRHLRRTGRCPGECVLSRARQDRRLRGFPRMG